MRLIGTTTRHQEGSEGTGASEASERNGEPWWDRTGLLEQLQVLLAQLQPLVRPPCDVAPGSGKAADDTTPNRIGDKPDDDGYCGGGLLGRQCCWRARGGNEIYLEADELGGESGKPFCLPLGESDIYGDVLALDPTKIPESLPECFEVRPVTSCRSLVEIADPPHLPRLLRLSGERRGEEYRTRASEECAAADHWMISSARASSDGGIVRPRAFAIVMSSHLPESPTILSARRTSSTPISEAHLL
jgi:hypothetical protein